MWFGIKTYGIKVKEALTGDWKELNKERMYFMFTTQLQGSFLHTDIN